MGPVSGVVVFFMLWWTMLFTVLPFSVNRDTNGTVDDPKLKQKIIITTILAIILWIIVYILIDMNLIDFRKIAEDMADAR